MTLELEDLADDEAMVLALQFTAAYYEAVTYAELARMLRGIRRYDLEGLLMIRAAQAAIRTMGLVDELYR